MMRVGEVLSAAGARERVEQVWTDVLFGGLQVCAAPMDRQMVLLPEPTPSKLLRRPDDHDCLASVLRGRMQKVLAAERGQALATVSGHLKRQLKAMGMDCCTRRLPLALALLAHATNSELVDIVVRDTGDDRSPWLLVPQLSEAALTELSPGQRDVTHRYLDGHCYADIAAARSSRPRTVANQLAAVFARYDAAGRFDLLRVILEHGQRSGARSALHLERGGSRTPLSSARAA